MVERLGAKRAAATPAYGPRSRPTRSSVSRTCPSNRRTATCTAACGPVRICTARASSPSTSARANIAGTSRRRIIRCGTTIIPTAPILVDAVKDGSTIKALAQATKQGLLFVLNRETGEPCGRSRRSPCRKATCLANGIRRRSRSRRFVTAIKASRVDDLIDFTPALRAEAERIVAEHQIGPIYTPAVAYNPNGPISTLMVMGGSNWPGGSFDPDTKMIYVTASVAVNSMTICRYAEGSAMPHGICLGPRRGRVRRLTQYQRARLAAAEAAVRHDRGRSISRSGAVAWEIPNGETPSDIKNHPALRRRRASAARAAQGNRRARSRRRRC